MDGNGGVNEQLTLLFSGDGVLVEPSEPNGFAMDSLRTASFGLLQV